MRKEACPSCLNKFEWKVLGCAERRKGKRKRKVGAENKGRERKSG